MEEFVRESRVYALDGLADRYFAFQFPPVSDIEAAAVWRLRLSLLAGKKSRVILEADPTKDEKAIYDLLDALTLPPLHVTHTEILITFAPTATEHSRDRTFKISHPYWCALRHDGRDLIIRQMLAASGIEPVEQPAEESIPGR